MDGSVQNSTVSKRSEGADDTDGSKEGIEDTEDADDSDGTDDGVGEGSSFALLYCIGGLFVIIIRGS